MITITRAQLDDLIQRGSDRRPELASRLLKAATLIEAGKVHHVGGTQWLVASSTTASDAYDVDSQYRLCTCGDAAYRREVHGGLCAHVLAAKMVRRIEAEAPLHLAYVAC